MKFELGFCTITIEYGTRKKVIDAMLALPPKRLRQDGVCLGFGPIRVIQGIKKHRSLTGATLKDSKEYVEMLMQENGIEP